MGITGVRVLHICQSYGHVWVPKRDEGDEMKEEEEVEEEERFLCKKEDWKRPPSLFAFCFFLLLGEKSDLQDHPPPQSACTR